MKRGIGDKLDSLIGVFAPGWAYSRQLARTHGRILSMGYEAADSSRYRSDRFHSNQSEDSILTFTKRERLQSASYEMIRNNPLVAGLLVRFANYLTVKTPQFTTSSSDWNDEAEAYLTERHKIIDSRKLMDVAGFRKTIVTEMLTAGDTGFVLLNSGQLQPVESMRIYSARNITANADLVRVVDGVILSRRTGQPVAFIVIGRTDSGNLQYGEGTQVNANNFLFIADQWRVDQVRGVPKLAPAIAKIQDMGELDDATLLKAKIEAFYATVTRTELPASMTSSLAVRGMEEDASDNRIRQKIESGANVELTTPGEMIEFLESKTPGQQYDTHWVQQARLVGASLGIPYDYLMLDFSNGSYSSQRQGLLEFKATLRAWNRIIDQKFDVPVARWLIAKGIKEGNIAPAPTDKFGVSEFWKVSFEHQMPDWVDPQKEAVANRENFMAGFKSHNQVCLETSGRGSEEVLAETGKSWLVAARQAKVINDLAKTEGLEFEIRPETLINTSVPGTVQGSQTTSKGQDEDEEPINGKASDLANQLTVRA